MTPNISVKQTAGLSEMPIGSDTSKIHEDSLVLCDHDFSKFTKFNSRGSARETVYQ